MDDLTSAPTRAELVALVAQLTDALSAERAEALADRRRADRIERELRAERDVYRRLVEQQAVAQAALTPDARTNRPASLADWADTLRQIEALPTTDTPGETR